MTSEQFSLLPTGDDDGAASLGGLEFAAGGGSQFGQPVGTEIGQGVPLEPRPEVLDRIEFGGVRRQERQFDRAAGGIDVLAHQPAAMRPQAIPDDKQTPLQVAMQRLEEFDDLGAADCALVQPEHALPEAQAGDHRQLFPVEVELDHRRLPFERPSAHARGPLRQARLVHKDDQASFALGLFFSAGQVRRFQRPIAASSRSAARFSGFWLENPSPPSRRHTCTVL